MNQVRHIKITQKHWNQAMDELLAPIMQTVDVCNKAIEIALAEQAVEKGVPHITVEQAKLAFTRAAVPLELLKIYNERIDKANAEQEQPLISADEARKLGVGNAEFFGGASDGWKLCSIYCSYEEGFQYRAIQQPEPVQPTSLMDRTKVCPCMRKWDDCTACRLDLFGSEEEHRTKVWEEHEAKKEANLRAELKAPRVKLDGELMARDDVIAKCKSLRDGFIQALNGDGDTEVAIDMLQSLPMVSDTPVAYRTKKLDSDGHWIYETGEILPAALHEFEPLFTSPQSLTKISADDIQLLERLEEIFHQTYPSSIEQTFAIGRAYLAIKHRSAA